MDKWNEELFNNLSRLVGNQRQSKSKAASVSPVRSIVNPNPIPVAFGCGGITGLMTSKAASSGTEGKITERIEGNKRVGYRQDGSIAWSMKTRLRQNKCRQHKNLGH